MTARQQIAAIDKDLTAIYRQMRKLEKIDQMSADSWQAAWNKHPDLHKAEHQLYVQRGALQEIVAIADSKIVARRESTKKRQESKSAIKRTRVFQYVYDCKEAAGLLGFTELSKYYALGLDGLRA
jgi:predicted HNH restriction endonuclease